MLKKFLKKNSAETENFSDSPSENLSQQKSLDQKLVHSLNTKKIPTLKQLKHIPQVLDKKQKKIISGLLLLVMLSLFFMAGNFYFKNFLPSPTPGGEYVEGLIGAPQYINPVLSQTNDVDSDISRLIFSGLLKYDANLQLVPDLTESWEASEDQKEYTFVIRQDVVWHDGEPLDIDDLIFTYESIKDSDFKSPLLISFRGVEIEKVDSRTIKFILPDSFPSFLEVLTVGILPEHIWAEIPPINANLTEYNIKPIGTGAWKFKSLTKDKLGNVKSYILEPNENYYGPKPFIQKLTFKFYPDFETAVAALKNNSIEGISFLPKELREELSGEKRLKYYSYYLPQYTAMFFNQKQNKILKDKNVRKALALSIDKSKILTEALQLEGEIIDGPILPVNVKISDDKKLSFDPNQANAILDTAKWEKITPQQYLDFLNKQAEEEEKSTEQDEENTDKDSTETEELPATEAIDAPEEVEPKTTQEFFRKKEDTILELTLTTVNQLENIKESELIAEMWQAIGVKVNLQIIEGNKISREVIKPRNYDILLFGIIVGSNPDPYAFWHSSQVADPGLNLSQFANREVDKLLETARVEVDPEKQRSSYQRFADILAAELPAIFLHNPTYSYALDKKIKGSNVDRIIVPSDRFNNIEDWYIKTKRQYQNNL